jgi:1-deoxy-D-xylulose-5-phosphate reductoisomerase
METFPSLKLAYKVGAMGGSMPTVFNAANELAVDKFLNRKITYLEIAEIIQYAVEQHKQNTNPTMEEILTIESETYDIINKKWN